MGGDEFAAALCFEANTPETAIRARAQQIFDKVSLTLKGTDGGTGVSVGMAISQADTTFTQLYEESDKALYQAKQNGRCRLVIR